MSDTTELLSMVKLRFSIDHPCVEESYVYGFDAAEAGLSEENNPFAPHSRESEHWSEGWWAGFYGEEAVFSLDAIDRTEPSAANDQVFTDGMGSFLVKVLEITSVIGVAALVGYQVLELVA